MTMNIMSLITAIFMLLSTKEKEKEKVRINLEEKVKEKIKAKARMEKEKEKMEKEKMAREKDHNPISHHLHTTAKQKEPQRVIQVKPDMDMERAKEWDQSNAGVVEVTTSKSIAQMPAHMSNK